MTHSSYPTTNTTLIDSVGSWPEHALDDINKARIKLMEKGHLEVARVAPKIYAPPLIWHGLDCQFHKTDITYKQFFKNNNLGGFVKDESHVMDFVLMQFGNDTIQINGIVMDFDKTCSFCPNVFHIHHEAVKLKDGRLVCHKCYANVFDSILQSSPTSMKRDDE